MARDLTVLPLSTTPRAMLVAAPVGNEPSTSPPQSPWWLGVVRAWWTFLPALLWVGDYLISRISAGAIKLPIPDEAMLFVSVALPALLGYLKTAKEQGRQDSAATLSALGVPMGVSLSASEARKVLTVASPVPPTPVVSHQQKLDQRVAEVPVPFASVPAKKPTLIKGVPKRKKS